MNVKECNIFKDFGDEKDIAIRSTCKNKKIMLVL